MSVAPSAGVELRRQGALVEKAAALLAHGPLPTSALAADLLSARGDSGAAASVVFGLLAGDARFIVDGGGVWSLRPPPAPADRPLREEEWVVVDVETTGGSPKNGHRITEVAAVTVSGGEIREVFSSLVNPERRIPSMITSLTGITDAMVASAPTFPAVLPQLSDVLRGRVFVAHNAPFDWRFVSAEVGRAAGRELAGRQLCTVRLARKLFPQLPSRSLDALADYFGLEIASRHRAEDDAVATAHLLLRFIELLEERGIEDWPGMEALLRKRAPRRKRRAIPRSMDSA